MITISYSKNKTWPEGALCLKILLNTFCGKDINMVSKALLIQNRVQVICLHRKH